MSIPHLLYSYFPWKRDIIEMHYDCLIPISSPVVSRPDFTSQEYLEALCKMKEIFKYIRYEIVDDFVFFGRKSEKIPHIHVWYKTGWIEKILEMEEVPKPYSDDTNMIMSYMIEHNYVSALEEYIPKIGVKELHHKWICLIHTMDMYNLLFKKLSLDCPENSYSEGYRRYMTRDIESVMRALFFEQHILPQFSDSVPLIEEIFPHDQRVIYRYKFGRDLRTDRYIAKNIDKMPMFFIAQIIDNPVGTNGGSCYILFDLIDLMPQEYRDVMHIAMREPRMKDRWDSLDLYVKIIMDETNIVSTLHTHFYNIKCLFGTFDFFKMYKDIKCDWSAREIIVSNGFGHKEA